MKKNSRYYKVDDFVSSPVAVKMLGYAHSNSLLQYIKADLLQPFGRGTKSRKYLKSQVEELYQLIMNNKAA